MNDFSRDKAFAGPELRLFFSADNWSDLPARFLLTTGFASLRLLHAEYGTKDRPES
jgi:hypothetical protein